MVHGKNRIPYWIDRRLTGLAGPDYDAPISFGLPLEPEDSQYGECRLIVMGDFNQIIGQGSRARPELRLALRKAFPPSMRIATSGLAFQGRRSIDHIALSADWAVGSLGVISNIHESRKLSNRPPN